MRILLVDFKMYASSKYKLHEKIQNLTSHTNIFQVDDLITIVLSTNIYLETYMKDPNVPEDSTVDHGQLLQLQLVVQNTDADPCITLEDSRG